MITGYINGQELRISSPALVADSIKYLEAEFHFAGHDWDGFTKTAYFLNDGKKIAQNCADDRITADMGLNLTEGEWAVKLSGVKGDARITTTTQRLYVRGFGSTDGELPDVTATQAEQLQAQIGSLADLETEVKTNLVAAINEAAQSGGGGTGGDSSPDHTLGLTGATVGQIAKISAVDDNGVPTAWEPVDLPSGGSEKWEQLPSVTLSADVQSYVLGDLSEYREIRCTCGKIASAVSGNNWIGVYGSSGGLIKRFLFTSLVTTTYTHSTFTIVRDNPFLGVKGHSTNNNLTSQTPREWTEAVNFDASSNGVRIDFTAETALVAGTELKIYGKR